MILPIFRLEDGNVAEFTDPNVEVRFLMVLLGHLMAIKGSHLVDFDVTHFALEHLTRLTILLLYLPSSSVADCSLDSGR